MITSKIDKIDIKQKVCLIIHSARSATFFIKPDEIREEIVELREADGVFQISRSLGKPEAIIWASHEIIAKLISWAG